MKIKTTIAGAAIAIAMASPAQASHFRGAALVPSVNASGMLTINAKSFWRITSPGYVNSVQISGGVLTSTGNITGASRTLDTTSDIRRAEANETFSYQLPGAGLYTLDWGSCCWVGGIDNANESSFSTQSKIYWDGSTANSPIIFDLENIQQEVVNNTPYSDNLDVIGNVSYDDTYVSQSMTRQAAGFSIDSTGQINIPSPNFPDNTRNIGADQAFSGRITASDDSMVEFVWLFDSVSQQSNNLAPTVVDTVVNALVGDAVSGTLNITDPDGDPLSASLVAFQDSLGNLLSGFNFDPSTFNFSWNTAGLAAGTYYATFQGSDGSLTDRGIYTFNLSTSQSQGPSNSVSEPAPALLAGLGALAMLGIRRRKAKLKK